MAKIPANTARIYVDEFALSGYLTATEMDVKQTTPVVTCFSDAGPRRVPAEHDHMGNHGGLMDAASGALDDLLWNALNTDEDHYLLQAFAGVAAGAMCYERIMRISGQPRKAKGGEAQLLDFSDMGSGPLSRSMVLAAPTITGTGNQTGQNVGATSSGTVLQVVYRVLSVSGAGSVTFAIQESSDNGAGDAYAAISGLGATFTAVGVQRFTTTSATEAWKRLTTTAFSGFTSVTALVTIGTVPN